MRISQDQLSQIQDMLDEYHFLAADVDEWRGATFLQSHAASSRHDGNHVRRIRLNPDVSLDEFFAEVERRQVHQTFRAVRLDPLTTPESIEARLLLEGYDCDIEIVMATDGEIRGHPSEVEIMPIDKKADWDHLLALFAQHESWGYAARPKEVFSMARRRGDAFTWFLALADGKAVGYFSEQSKSGLGYLEDLFVLPAYRLHGIATALVHHAAASARSNGARVVFLPCAANDTPKEMYRRMGFEPVFVFRNYSKPVPPAA
jgi:GNAT superfamily N-acetyltransferase